MHAGRRHDLPLEELRAYMDSMRIDCGPVRIASWEELTRYMNGSAAAVGRIMAPLLGAPGEASDSFASLGLAFQLTNFIRDVREDWALDRIYLPDDERARFGVSEDEIGRGEATPGFRALLALEVERARDLFAEGHQALAAVEPRVRPGMRMARAVYLTRARPGGAPGLRRAGSQGQPAPVGGRSRRARVPEAGSLMTKRATLARGQRTPIDRPRADVLVCGASFAGLAVARELAGSGADVLIVDRYEIGERQTSACAAPTPWLHAMGVEGSIRQEIPCMSFHTPHGSVRYRLPWSWSSFDYPELCRLLFEQCDARFEIAKVQRREPGGAVRTDRGDLDAGLVVDALGWRRVLAAEGYQPPEAPLSRGLEVHPPGGGQDLDVWIDRSLVRFGYSWSVPADGEQRWAPGRTSRDTT